VTEINNLGSEIQRYLQQYASSVRNEIEVSSKETAQALVKELKQTSPKKSGKYKKGWRMKKARDRNRGVKYIVHNKTDYQLTHLLEHGHAKRGGGRVESKIHIAPAEEKHVRAFLDRIEGVIRS
jgi:hypothetical protein